MAATAQSVLPTPAPLILPDTGQGCDPCQAAIQGLVRCPDDHEAAVEFLKTLGQLDASAPRSDELTAALIAALSTPLYAAWRAEHFATRSLRLEFNTAVSSGAERIDFPPQTLSLVTAILSNRRVRCLQVEAVLISLRATLLDLARSGEEAQADQIALAEAMARHSFRTEYIWEDTAGEQADVDQLVAKLCEQIETGADVSAFDLFMIGAYRPLYAVDAVRDWVRRLARQNRNAIDATLGLLVLDRLIEDETPIERLTPITGQVSKKVQSQYEENPYPRWTHMPMITQLHDIEAYVGVSIGQATAPQGGVPQQAKVLVAGAGTGAHPISLALTLPHAAVLAIDLSRASLAYATREAAARGAQNVAFAQADILRLAEVDVQFDLIESAGVLHHMEDPEAGLQALVKVLKPGGHLRLALYSQAARRGVNAARTLFANGAYPPGVRGIRAFRRDLIEADDPALASLPDFPDFFAASEFRDLVMHVQEHQFTLPQIKAMLKRNGLKFVGFSSEAARAVLRNMPQTRAQKRLRDLDAWDRHEKRNPDTFFGMYDFFCVKS